jgi:hypothetical protein
MATIRKKRSKWQVQVRRKGMRPVSRTFLLHKDAEAWARQMEVQIDRAEIPANPRLLERHTRGELSGPLLGNSQSKKARLPGRAAEDDQASEPQASLSKNGQPRVLPLSLASLELLRGLERPAEKLFPITSNAFRLAWERLRN